MKTLADLKQEEKVVLYCIGVCDELRRKKLLSGGLSVNPDGLALGAELFASGFKPADEEVAYFVTAVGVREDNDTGGLATLIKAFRDGTLQPLLEKDPP